MNCRTQPSKTPLSGTRPADADSREGRSDLDLTPMIDVTFLILIFFMVTASFSLQRAIEMPASRTDQPSRVAVESPPADPVRLVVDHRGGFFLMAPQYQREIVGKQSLVTELTQVRTAGADPALRIEVETEAKLQKLVDAIDAATLAGFTQYELNEVDSPWI